MFERTFEQYVLNPKNLNSYFPVTVNLPFLKESGTQPTLRQVSREPLTSLERQADRRSGSPWQSGELWYVKSTRV